MITNQLFSNGGVFGSLFGTPIINPPQSAILGMHGVFERPVVRNGQVRFQMSDLLNPPSLQIYFYLHNLPVIFQKMYIYIFLNSLSPFDKISWGGWYCMRIIFFQRIEIHLNYSFADWPTIILWNGLSSTSYTNIEHPPLNSKQFFAFYTINCLFSGIM